MLLGVCDSHFKLHAEITSPSLKAYKILYSITISNIRYLTVQNIESSLISNGLLIIWSTRGQHRGFRRSCRGQLTNRQLELTDLEYLRAKYQAEKLTLGHFQQQIAFD